MCQLRHHPRRPREEARDVAARRELSARAGEDDEPNHFVVVELGEQRRELVAREHRDPVELAGHVEGDRGDAALVVAVEPEAVECGHAISLDSSLSTLRRIFPAALLGSADTKRYSRGQLAPCEYRFVSALPRSAAGKILRRVLRDESKEIA